MTRIILSGCNGKMGQAIVKAVADREDAVISAGVDIFTDCGYDFPVFNDFKKIDTEADVIIDFSNPVVLDGLLSHARGKKLPAVICTTGYSTAQVQQIKEAAKEIAVFHSGNMSLGINLIIELSKKAASVFGSAFDIEIVEKHHNQKIDAPSGTALMIADGISEVMDKEPQYVYDRHAYRKNARKTKSAFIPCAAAQSSASTRLFLPATTRCFPSSTKRIPKRYSPSAPSTRRCS